MHWMIWKAELTGNLEKPVTFHYSIYHLQPAIYVQVTVALFYCLAVRCSGWK